MVTVNALRGHQARPRPRLLQDSRNQVAIAVACVGKHVPREHASTAHPDAPAPAVYLVFLRPGVLRLPGADVPYTATPRPRAIGSIKRQPTTVLLRRLPSKPASDRQPSVNLVLLPRADHRG